jgi:glycosyltransferase involved in cell wall biosynthesis
VTKLSEIESQKLTQKKAVVLAVIPAYNESKNIGPVIAEVSKYVDHIIVVDDGSVDRTKEVAANMNARVIRNKRNMGKGFALKRGIIECLRYNPDIVVTIDADGQHDPSEIPKLLSPIISEEADVVIGSRYVPGSITDAPFYRKIGLYLLNNINRVLVKTSVTDSQSGYRAYTKNVLSTILKYDASGYAVEVEQLALLENSGFRVMEVPITVKYRGLDITSKSKPFPHGAHILYAIFRIAVERKPLLFFGLSGLLLLILSIMPASELLAIFNETRYFSLPLALISVSLAFFGVILILISFIFFALKRIRQREEIIATSIFDLLNRMKD